MSDLQKSVVLNGQDSIAVFKDGGVVYRAADIESYTPIVFRNLKLGQFHDFNLGTILDKSYQVVNVAHDIVADDDFLNVPEHQASNLQYTGASFAIVEQGKRVSWTWLQLY